MIRRTPRSTQGRSSAAADVYKRQLGISPGLLFRWRKLYTPQGEKTQYATLEEEYRALKLENAELKIERDMLKKATAYFAKLQK